MGLKPWPTCDAVKNGVGSLEVRVDLESCTASLLFHHADVGEGGAEIFTLVPAPPDHDAGLKEAGS